MGIVLPLRQSTKLNDRLNGDSNGGKHVYREEEEWGLVKLVVLNVATMGPGPIANWSRGGLHIGLWFVAGKGQGLAGTNFWAGGHINYHHILMR